MPADEAKKLVEELTDRIEEVFALNRQRARLVDILISASAGDMAEAETELKSTDEELFGKESELNALCQQITNMLRLLLSMRRGLVEGVDARKLARTFNADCSGPVELFKPYDDEGNDLGEAGPCPASPFLG